MKNERYKKAEVLKRQTSVSAFVSRSYCSKAAGGFFARKF